ncbi:MAG: hypothetical protein HIU82_15340 [Proteobacteria bacterium]|nr:hypothetical protein [Pseudomonadota bacterium]
MPVNGTSVPLSGRMFHLLDDIYSRSEAECDIDITFSPTSNGKQQNDCRDLILRYLNGPTLSLGKLLAERLRDNTDGRSGLGLMFLIAGKEGPQHKFIISRFPTDSAIYVDDNARTLTVQFLERVFMKNKTSYKAVTYRDRSLHGGFWSGRAVDKQLNSLGGQLSDYWIVDFLRSEFSVTPAAGTRRFALALRDAAKKSELPVKQELTAAATLANGLGGQRLSIDSFAQQFNLTRAAKDAVVRELKNPRSAQETFEFDLTEFRNLIAYKSVELSNGALLTAESSEFDDVFQKRVVDDAKHLVEFSTEGRIVDEKLKTAR